MSADPEPVIFRGVCALCTLSLFLILTLDKVMSDSVLAMDELRTQRGDVDFHRARRMFCIRNGELRVAPEGTTMSHLEWFEAEGWIGKDSLERFMNSTVRGIFLPARSALFFYKSVGFYFDTVVIHEASRWAAELMSTLALDRHVEVHVGPPDAVIRGIQYRQKRLGTIESVTKERLTA